MDNGGPFKKALAWLEDKQGIKGIQISAYNSHANGKSNSLIGMSGRHYGKLLTTELIGYQVRALAKHRDHVEHIRRKVSK